MSGEIVYGLGASEVVGVFPVRQDITVLPADESRRLQLGWTVYEEIGVAIINDFAVARIEVEVPYNYDEEENALNVWLWDSRHQKMLEEIEMLKSAKNKNNSSIKWLEIGG